MHDVLARRQMDTVAVVETDLAARPDGDRFGEARLMDMEERVRPEVFAHPDDAGPRPFGFGHVDMFRPG